MSKFESVLSTCTVMTYSLWAYGPIIEGQIFMDVNYTNSCSRRI